MAYFAASTDDAETNKRFAESLHLDYPALGDPEKKTARAYGVLRGGIAARWTFIIGPDGKILLVDRDVKAAQAGENLARQLAELGIARRAK